jgi:hypothetical protein
MKLNDRSVRILKNFSSINPSLQFDEGETLRTISPNKTMMARAKLDNVIPKTFAIYDLSRFLGVMSLFEDPELSFAERMVNIKSPGRSVSYTFADPSTIITPPNREIVLEDPDVVFELKESVFAELMKALGVMSLPDFVVAGEDGKIVLRATDTKNPSSDTYDVVVDGATSSNDFVAVFKTENLKIVPSDYTVSLSSKGISHFASDGVEYWISIESNSTFN